MSGVLPIQSQYRRVAGSISYRRKRPLLVIFRAWYRICCQTSVTSTSRQWISLTSKTKYFLKVYLMMKSFRFVSSYPWWIWDFSVAPADRLISAAFMRTCGQMHWYIIFPCQHLLLTNHNHLFSLMGNILKIQVEWNWNALQRRTTLSHHWASYRNSDLVYYTAVLPIRMASVTFLVAQPHTQIQTLAALAMFGKLRCQRTIKQCSFQGSWWAVQVSRLNYFLLW